MKRLYIFGAILLALIVGVLFFGFGGSQTPSGQPPLDHLTAQNVADLKTDFNAAKDDVRVLLLLSPT